MNESKSSAEAQTSEEGYEAYIAKAGEIYHRVAAHVDGMLGYEHDAKYHTDLLEEGKAGEDAKEKFKQGKEKVSELVEQAREKIQGTHEKVKGKVEETREKAKDKMKEAKGKMKGNVEQVKHNYNMFEGLSDDEEQETEGGHFNVEGMKSHHAGSNSVSSLSKTAGIPRSQLNEAPTNDHINHETKNFHELGKRDEKHKSKLDEQLPENQRNRLSDIGENDENKRYNAGNYVTEPVDFTTGKMKGPGEKHHFDKLKGNDSHRDKWSHVASVGETDFEHSKSTASFMNKKNKNKQQKGFSHDKTKQSYAKANRVI